jgi:DNA-binding transcriptional LysR family regulator
MRKPNIEDVSVRLLRGLCVLVEERSVSNAARRLGTSQPAMSRLLQTWRRLLDDEVMVQAGRRMEPTPRAADLAAALAPSLASLEERLSPPPTVPEHSKRVFRLAAWDYVEALLLPPLLGRLRTLAPQIGIEARPWVERHVVPMLERGELDFMVGLFRDLPGGCYRRPLFDDRFVCVARADHPGIGARLRLRDLVRLPHLLVAPFGAARGAVDIELARRGLSRRVLCFVSNFRTAPEIVRASDLLATLPERALGSREGLRVFSPPLALPTFTFELVWHERTHRSAEHRWLRERVLELFDARARSSVGRARERRSTGSRDRASSSP